MVFSPIRANQTSFLHTGAEQPHLPQLPALGHRSDKTISFHSLQLKSCTTSQPLLVRGRRYMLSEESMPKA